jgi:hypothetical protein
MRSLAADSGGGRASDGRTCSSSMALSALAPELNSMNPTDCPLRSVRRRLLMYPCAPEHSHRVRRREPAGETSCAAAAAEAETRGQGRTGSHRHIHADLLQRTDLQLRRQLRHKQRGRRVIRGGALSAAPDGARVAPRPVALALALARPGAVALGRAVALEAPPPVALVLIGHTAGWAVARWRSGGRQQLLVSPRTPTSLPLPPKLSLTRRAAVQGEKFSQRLIVYLMISRVMAVRHAVARPLQA